MTTQDLIDCINIVERKTQTYIKTKFFVETICPRFKNYSRERFQEICEYVGNSHKFNVFPNLAIFNMAEEKTVSKPKSRPLINTWDEDTFKKKKYKPGEMNKVFEDIKKLYPWLSKKGDKDD